jgi:kynurenine formamidase
MTKKARIVDLSLEIKEGPGVLGAKIEYLDHKGSVPQMIASWPGIKENDLPGGLGWSAETLTLNTHSGTHMDAPYHFYPTMAGEKSRTIDEMPLEWAFGPGVVLDMRHMKPRTVITPKDVQQALEKIEYTIKPLDIILIMTGADRYWKENDIGKYVSEYAGMGREATLWLMEQGVKLVGTDAVGWDRSFASQAEEFRKTGDRSLIWEGHFAGIEGEYYQMEKLTNLDKLPPYGFTAYCFPIKILKAGAAWVRPVAIIEVD